MDSSSIDRERLNLRADCARCQALCCVAPAFSASTDFAIDKPAGQPCPNLRTDFRCGIHNDLRPQGFPGCTVYDCFGAGQKVSQVSFSNRDWRRNPEIAQQMFDVFAVMRQLHELLWYLAEAVTLAPARSLHGELRRALDETERMTSERPDALVQLDVSAHRTRVNELLSSASELVRTGFDGPRSDYRAADLVGADLRNNDLRAANFRGAHLIAADLRNANLRGADLTGADLRGADVRGADFGESIFLIQAQLDAARGDVHTRLPPTLSGPSHWRALRTD